MKLLLRGHGERYALEQLQLCLFPALPLDYTEAPFVGDGAISTLSRGRTWLTATAKLTLGGRTARAARRIPVSEETVRLRRRILQQSYYLALGRAGGRPAHENSDQGPPLRRHPPGGGPAAPGRLLHLAGAAAALPRCLRGHGPGRGAPRAHGPLALRRHPLLPHPLRLLLLREPVH